MQRAPCDEGVHKDLSDRRHFMQICFVQIMMIVGVMIVFGDGGYHDNFMVVCFSPW